MVSASVWLAVTSAPTETAGTSGMPSIGLRISVQSSSSRAPVSDAWALFSVACACSSATRAESTVSRVTPEPSSLV